MMITPSGRSYRPSFALPALLAAFLAIPIGGCGKVSFSKRPTNVFVILVDTLRSDHLPAYGYDRIRTPNIDAFLKTAVLFEQARSQASCTFPSVNSLLTSQYPFSFISRGLPADDSAPIKDKQQMKKLWQSANRPAQFGIPADMRSLPEILKENGYHTVAVSASPIVRDKPSEEAVNRWGGFGRGFDVFHEKCLNEDAACVNRAALNLLDDAPADSPLFMYLHYMDPHDPYQAPGDFRGRYAKPYSGKPFIKNGNPHPISGMLRTKTRKELNITGEEIQHLVDLYDEEIEYFDYSFGVLIRELERRGILNDSVIVLVSDHGESFLEHEFIAHCFSVYDSEIKIPIAMRFPDRIPAGGRRLSMPVGLIDVTPTVLGYLDIDTESLSFKGRNLLQYLDPSPSGQHQQGGEGYVFSAQRAARSITTETDKLIVNLLTGKIQLFRHSDDPAEAHNVAAEFPDLTEDLRGSLFEFLKESEGASFQEKAGFLSDSVEEKLRSLGYIQ